VRALSCLGFVSPNCPANQVIRGLREVRRNRKSGQAFALRISKLAQKQLSRIALNAKHKHGV
jgi:hypothetical protein